MGTPPHSRRLALLAVVAAAALGPAAAFGSVTMPGAGPPGSGPFFGNPIPQVGTGASASVSSAPLLHGVIAEAITATTRAGNHVSGHARLRLGHNTAVGATFTWSGACDWTFTVQSGRAGSASGDTASLDARGLAGTISSAPSTNTAGSGAHVGCPAPAVNLTAPHRVAHHGMTLAFAPGIAGLIGQAHVASLAVGGLAYSGANVSVNFASTGTHLHATLPTDLGALNTYSHVTAPSGQMVQALRVTGAHFSLEGGAVSFSHFNAQVDVAAPSSGCATFTAPFTGTAVVNGTSKAVSNGTFTVNCGTVTALQFSTTATNGKGTDVRTYTLSRTSGVKGDLVLSHGAGSETAFFGTAIPTNIPPAGITLHNVDIVPGSVTATVIRVKSQNFGQVSADATLTIGGGHTVEAALEWNDRCNWTFSVTGSKERPPASDGTALDPTRLSGVVTSANCHPSVQMTLDNYVFANTTMNLMFHGVPGGIQGSAEVNDLVLGGITYPRVKVSLSTIDVGARLEGTMESDIGTFDVDTWVKAPNGSYEQYLKVKGADLAFETATVHFKEFGFEGYINLPASGCASFSLNITGKLVMRSVEYTLTKGKIALSPTNCGAVQELSLGMIVSQTDARGITTTGDLNLALVNTPGNAADYIPSLGGSQGQVATINFDKALLGYADLSKSITFSRKYGTGGMYKIERTVKVGVVLGVALYTADANADAEWQVMIGAGGYFSADRISGAFGCTFEAGGSMNFGCGGVLRVNPRHAGIWHIGWNNF